jgi:hypothetical protein
LIVFKCVLIYSTAVSLSSFQFSLYGKIKNKNKAYIYLNMLRKRENSRMNRIEITPNDTNSLILPPSPKKINDELCNITEPIKIVERCRVQCANPIFDPNNASPASEFMNILKLRMSIYYEHDLTSESMH